jgi:hypothetical protein
VRKHCTAVGLDAELELPISNNFPPKSSSSRQNKYGNYDKAQKMLEMLRLAN